MPQKIAVLQSMWAMLRNHPDGIEKPIEENIGLIVDGGFDGVSVLCNDEKVVRETASIIQPLGLVVEAMCTIQSPTQLSHRLEMATALGAHHLNVQADFRPRSLAEALSFLEECERITENASLPVLFETHRDRITNDLMLTIEMLQMMPGLRLLADLSHYLVSREFSWPVTDADNALINQILDRSWAMHGRVASQHQVQIEIAYPHHRQWLDLFLGWWRYGFQSWQRRAPADATLCFTCEIGPSPYAITGRDGNDTTDRFEEAKVMKNLIQHVWYELQSETAVRG